MNNFLAGSAELIDFSAKSEDNKRIRRQRNSSWLFGQGGTSRFRLESRDVGMVWAGIGAGRVNTTGGKTMRVKVMMAGLLAVAGLLASSAAGHAGDVFRLGLPAGEQAPTLKLGEMNPNADTVDAWFRGGFHGGFHGFRGGWGGGWGWRGGWGGGWRGGWGGWGGGWRGGWGGWGWRGGWGGYYGGYSPWVGLGCYSSPWVGYSCYSYPSVSYSYYGGFCPISTTSPGVVSTFSLNLGPTTLRAQTQPGVPTPVPAPQPGNGAPNNGTFNYDGGPRSPVPLPSPGSDQAPPRSEPAPMRSQPTVPLEGRPVSIQVVRPTPKKYTYPAYGERSR